MSQKRKVALARFDVLVEDCGDGEYIVIAADHSWTIARGTDGELEVVESPDQVDLPARLTNAVILAAVDKFTTRYQYNL